MSEFTRNDPRDAWMAAALRSRAEHSDPRSDCPSADKIWDAVRLQVPVDERLQIIDHLAECATCAEAWSLAVEFERSHEARVQPQTNAFNLPAAATAAPSVPVRALYGRRALLIGTAAALLVALGIGSIMLRPAVPHREATETPQTPTSTPPQAPQQTQIPVPSPAPVSPSPSAPATPTSGRTPGVAAARGQITPEELAHADAEIVTGRQAQPAATTSGTSTVSPASDESAIRRVVDTYKRAIETQDVSLFLSVRPGLSANEQAQLRASFQAIYSQQITITIDDIQIDDKIAIARVSRQDVVIVEGERRQTASTQQTFRFAKSASGWIITGIDR
jgi:hypothetical protein